MGNRDQDDRIIGAGAREEERLSENRLRPESLTDYVGQDDVKENIGVFIQAARMRGEALDHVLLNGPPGLGKTTLSLCIAREMGASVKTTSGPAIQRPIDLLVLLKSLREGDVLFIDEIHRLTRVVEEILYPAMEDFVFDRIMGRGTNARSRRIPLPRFTLVGATTRGGMISSPLRGRFGIQFNLSFYSQEDIQKIILRSSGILGINIKDEGSLEVARRSRGTPRVANRLLRRVWDYAQVLGSGILDGAIANHALERMGIDAYGLDQLDRRILECLVERYNGRPVGLDTLAAYVQEEPDNIEEICEPYLLKMGLICRTPRGRTASPEAFRYFGLKPPPIVEQQTLFG